jgi:hypothetical protein
LARVKVNSENMKVRQQIVFALTDLAGNEEKQPEVFKLIDSWARGNSTNAQWTARYILIFGRGLPAKERDKLFKTLHMETPDKTFDVLIQMLDEKKTRARALAALSAFWHHRQKNAFMGGFSQTSPATLHKFVSTKSKILQDSVKDKFLLDEASRNLLEQVSNALARSILEEALDTGNVQKLLDCVTVNTSYPVVQAALGAIWQTREEKLVVALAEGMQRKFEVLNALQLCCQYAAQSPIPNLPQMVDQEYRQTMQALADEWQALITSLELETSKEQFLTAYKHEVALGKIQFAESTLGLIPDKVEKRFMVWIYEVLTGTTPSLDVIIECSQCAEQSAWFSKVLQWASAEIFRLGEKTFLLDIPVGLLKLKPTVLFYILLYADKANLDIVADKLLSENHIWNIFYNPRPVMLKLLAQAIKDERAANRPGDLPFLSADLQSEVNRIAETIK